MSRSTSSCTGEGGVLSIVIHWDTRANLTGTQAMLELARRRVWGASVRELVGLLEQ